MYRDTVHIPFLFGKGKTAQVQQKTAQVSPIPRKNFSIEFIS